MHLEEFTDCSQSNIVFSNNEVAFMIEWKEGFVLIYGYARCSTNDRTQDIDRQVRELKQQGAADDTIYMEYISGTKKTGQS